MSKPDVIEIEAVDARAIWTVREGRRHLLAVFDREGPPILVAELPAFERRALAAALLRSLLPTLRRSS
jgi:hypothetical protein